MIIAKKALQLRSGRPEDGGQALSRKRRESASQNAGFEVFWTETVIACAVMEQHADLTGVTLGPIEVRERRDHTRKTAARVAGFLL